MILPDFFDSLVFRDFEVSSPVLYTAVKKIFYHGNFEPYGVYASTLVA